MKKTVEHKPIETSETQRKPKKTMLRRLLAVGITVVVVLAILVAIGVYIDKEKRVFKECAIEAGTPVQASDFVRFKHDKRSASFAFGTSSYDVTVPGEYEITIQLGKKTYSSKLVVRDTVAPVVALSPKTTMFDHPIDPNDFIVTMNDQTAVTVEYQVEPDYKKVGDQDVTILFRDLGGNVTTSTTSLRVVGIYSEITREAGSAALNVGDFAFSEENASLLTPLSDVKMDQPGDYTVSFSVDGIRYDSIVHLQDTTPPRATGIDYEGFAGYPKTAEEMIEGLADATAVTVEFVEDPKFDEAGERDVQIRLTDLGNNESIVTSHMVLAEDTEAPVISGTKDISIITGQAIAYKNNITVTDNADADITYTVDNSTVDVDNEGVYEVVYSATDKAGNTAEVKIKVTVVYKPYTEDDLWALCDEILAKIITDDMTEKQKVEAIFNWVDWNIKYQGHAEKTSWIQGAYEGIKNRIGDCYNTACACYALYTRAGIENFIITRDPISYAQHFWNAVKIDGKWYHCDALTTREGTRFFMWSSAQVKEYADGHRGYFYYKASDYPVEIP